MILNGAILVSVLGDRRIVSVGVSWRERVRTGLRLEKRLGKL